MTTSEPASERIDPAASWRVKRHYAALVLLAVIAVLFVCAKWFSRSTDAAPVSAVAVPAASAAPAIPAEPAKATHAPEDSEKQRLLGSWRDQYYGERTMTFLADGTGTMIIKLDSVGQAIYGPQLLFDLAWTIRDGALEMKFTGGEPKDSVATISKLWGDTHLQKIESLTEAELQLRSTDSQNLYTLKRLPDSQP